MTNHSLLRRGISIAMRLGSIDNPAHFQLILLRQLNITRSPVFLQATGLGRAGNGDQPLRSHPGECNLTSLAALAGRKLLDLFHNCAILVEVLALEFGDLAAEIIRREIVGGVVGKFVDEPAMS